MGLTIDVDLKSFSLNVWKSVGGHPAEVIKKVGSDSLQSSF